MRFTVSFDLDYVDEKTGQKTANSLNAGDKDFILDFLRNVPVRINIAEWTKDLGEN
jgi:hypothetical protein